MKKFITKILTVTACAAMMLAAVPATNANTVQAASKAQGTIDLKAKKLTIPKGKTQTIKNKTVTMVKNRKYQVKSKFGSTTVTTKGTYKSSKPAIATVSATGLVTAKAPGTATISVTYNGTKQMFNVKVVASHTHAWKTTTKATCRTQGKKLCQTCGVTGTVAVSKKHSFQVTKKATCETAGKQVCTVCLKSEDIPKATHSYVKETATSVEGRGKVTRVCTTYCGKCDADMTNWTNAQISAHKFNANNKHYGPNEYGAAGEARYEKYVMTQTVDEWCRNCGAIKPTVKKDLYECTGPGGQKMPAGVNLKTYLSYDYYCQTHNLKVCPSCKLEIGTDDGICRKDGCPGTSTTSTASTTNVDAVAQAPTADSDIVLTDTDGIMGAEIIVDDDAEDTNAVISGNTVVSNNEMNTDITDPDGDGDISFDDGVFEIDWDTVEIDWGDDDGTNAVRFSS